MQELANNLPPIENIERINKLAQTYAQDAYQQSAEAICLAAQAGEMLKQHRAVFKSGSDFDMWAKAHLSADLYQWSDRYLRIQQMDLPLDDLDNARPNNLRSALRQLELIPGIEKKPVDHAQDHWSWRLMLSRRIFSLERALKDKAEISDDDRATMQVDFKQLYEWMRREVYCV